MQGIINSEILKYEEMEDTAVAPSNPTVLEMMIKKRTIERAGSTSILESYYEQLLEGFIEISKMDTTNQINHLSTHLEGIQNNQPVEIYWDNIFASSNIIEELIYLRRLYNLPDKWINTHASALIIEQKLIYDILNNETELIKLCLLRDRKTIPEFYQFSRQLYRKRLLDMMRSVKLDFPLQ